MVALGQHLPVASQPLVHAPRQPDPEAPQPTHEGGLAARLDDEVDVVGLDAEVRDSKAGPPSGMALGDGAERRPHRPREEKLPERGDAFGNAPRHVGGVIPVMKRPRPVRNAVRGPPSPASPPADSGHVEGELFHWANYIEPPTESKRNP